MSEIQLAQRNQNQLKIYDHQNIETWRKSAFCFEKNGVRQTVEHRRQNSWKMQEKIKHLVFLYYFEFPSQQGEDKPTWQIFKQMADFIKTKNPNQCRIYHKRSINKYKNISNFVAEIKKKTPELGKILASYKDQLLSIQPNQQKQTKHQGLVLNLDRLHEYAENISKQDYKSCDIGQEMDQIQEQVKIQPDQEKMQVIKTDTTCKGLDFEQEKGRPLFRPMLQIEKPYHMNLFQPLVLNHEKIYQSYNQSFSTFAHESNCKKGSNRQQCQKTQKQWQECFQLYLAWTSKLSKLIGIQ